MKKNASKYMSKFEKAQAGWRYVFDRQPHERKDKFTQYELREFSKIYDAELAA